MKKCIVPIAFAAILAGCSGGSSLEGNWRHERGGVLSFRSDGKLTLTDTNGRTYSGKWKDNWRNQYSSEVELTLDGMPDSSLEKCNYQITVQNGASTLWVEGCIFTGILKKQ